MIGVLVVTHGGLGAEMVVCAENVVGKQAFLSLGLTGSESPDGFEGRLTEGRLGLDGSGGGVGAWPICWGGRPATSVFAWPGTPNTPFELVTGVNLPMLITALANRHYMPLAQLGSETGGRRVPKRPTAASTVAGSSSPG
jgi:hypothetical protein